MDEKTFWKSTPRKLFALLDCHIEANMTDEQKAQNNIVGRKNRKQNNKEVVGQIASW